MTDYQQYNYPPPPTCSYPPSPVNRHEGLAVAALVLGIIGVSFGVIPLTFWIALPLGMLALIFGLIGRRPTKGKWGVALGVAAIVLGIIGAIIVNNAVNDLDKTLNTDTGTSIFDTSATGLHEVVYTVSGDAVFADPELAPTADVTYETASGITQQQAVTLPWIDTESMGAGEVPLISAQNSGLTDAVTCSITVDGVAVASNTASGEYAIAECDGDLLGLGG